MRTRIPFSKVFTTVHTVHWILFNKEPKNKRGAKSDGYVFLPFTFIRNATEIPITKNDRIFPSISDDMFSLYT